MPNEVKTTLSIDDASALAKIANYKRQLSSVGGLGTPSASASDPSLAKAQTDIARYQKQRADGETRLTQLLERQSEQRSRNEIKAYQRTLSEIERIRKSEERKLSSSSSSGRGFLTAGAISPTSLVQGTAIGAAAYFGVGLAQSAIDRAVEQSRANRLIASSATEAGLAQGVLAEKNKEFAASVGLSNVAAAETTALITRLATFSGNASPERISQLLKAFANLGAARGIGGQDLQGLIGTILSGQDEGLNRLGIADPGILQKAYAKKVGVGVNDLTQAQKVTAATEAVLEKAGTFAGAAETRLNSLEGQVAKTTSAFENFTNALSQNFVSSGPVTDFINEASRALQGLQIDLETVNRELAKGKTPQQIVAENDKGPGFGDYLTSAATGALGVTGIATLLGFSDAEINRAVSPTNIHNRRNAELVDRITATQKGIADQKTAAQGIKAPLYQQFETDINAKQKVAFEAYFKEREGFLSSSRSRELDSLSSNYSVTQALQKQHLSIQKTSEVTSIRETTALTNRNLQNQIDTNRKYYNSLIENANSLAALADKPEDKRKYQLDAVKYAQEGSAAIVAAQNEIKANSIESQTAQIESLRKTKESYRDLIVGIEAKKNPFISIFEDGAKAVKNVADSFKDLGREAQAAATNAINAQTKVNAYGQGLQNRLQAFGYRFEAQQFRQGFNFDLSDNTPLGIGNRNQLLRNQIGLINSENLPGVTYGADYNLTKSIQETAQRTFNSPEARSLRNKEIIGLTQGLDPSKLSGDIRTAAAVAREEEAKRLVDQERDAKDFQTKMLAALTDGFPVKVVSGSDLVTIRNQAPDNAVVTSATPSATNRRYAK